MKLATWNVNGIRARQAQVQEWIARERPDVVCLQEIKATSDQIPVALCEMEGYWCYWHGGKGYSGVAMWVSMDAYAASYQQSDRRLVLMGDMNVARTERDVHPKERKPRAIGQLPEERVIIERILGRGLVDLGRAMDPDNDGLFTWWAPWRNMRQRNIGWRLDYAMVSESLASRASACVVQKDVGTSDHAPVV